MPFATTHILIAIILIELFREYFIKNNKKFPRYYILIAAIGGILPDLDLAAYYILSFFDFTFAQIHRTFSHTIFIPLILFFIGIFILFFGIKSSALCKKHINLHISFFILSGGMLLHLILDAMLSGSIIPFYPFSDYFIGLNLINLFPENWRNLIAPTIDGILLIFWLFWMEFKLKIDDYF
jgi:membrane-bound metal-dependent hydrolase YbcI (DUF457 family)